MEKKLKRDIIISLILNVFIFVANIISVALYFSTYASDRLAGGLRTFRFFTTDSNLILAFSCIILSIYQIRWLINKKEIPQWINVFKFVSVVATMVTFITTAIFLTPAYTLSGHSIFALFEGNLFFLHFFCPVLGCLSFILFDHYIFNKKYSYFGCISVPLYSLFYCPLVLSEVWPDFYGFTFGGHKALFPLSLIVMYGMIYGLTKLIYKLKQVRENKF